MNDDGISNSNKSFRCVIDLAYDRYATYSSDLFIFTVLTIFIEDICVYDKEPLRTRQELSKYCAFTELSKCSVQFTQPLGTRSFLSFG